MSDGTETQVVKEDAVVEAVEERGYDKYPL